MLDAIHCDAVAFCLSSNLVVNRTTLVFQIRRLTTLRFDENHFGRHLGGKIPERLFRPLRHMTSLSLKHCDIRSIPSDAFRGLHHLQVYSDVFIDRISARRSFQFRCVCIGVLLNDERNVRQCNETMLRTWRPKTVLK